MKQLMGLEIIRHFLLAYQALAMHIRQFWHKTKKNMHNELQSSNIIIIIVVRKGIGTKSATKGNKWVEVKKKKKKTNVTIANDFENERALFFTSVAFNNHHLPKTICQKCLVCWWKGGWLHVDKIEWFEEILHEKWPIMMVNNHKL